jgi:hypothetical protein
MVALCQHTQKHIRGGWSHYTDTSKPVEVMGIKIWSLSNPGFEPATFRSLAQHANHCVNRAHAEEKRSRRKLIKQNRVKKSPQHIRLAKSYKREREKTKQQ